MEKELRTRLSQPFPESYIHQRKGSFGKTLNYLSASAVIERLNECFENDWSFMIITHEVLPTDEVMVHGRLTALGVSKDAFGRGQQAVNRDTGEIVSAADAYKSAVSDCIKRCARLLGVGAYLYSDEPVEEPVQLPRNGATRPSAATTAPRSSAPSKTTAHTEQKPAPRKQETTDDAATPSDTRITQKQLSAIWNVGRKAGHNADAIRQYSQEMYGAFPEYLTRKQASDFITELSAAVDRTRRVG